MHNGKTVVITYGSFDPLHEGHLNLFRRCKQLGDYLIVGVATQRSHDLANSGKKLLYPLSERVKAVQDCGLVDKVIIEDDIRQDPADIIKYHADYYVMGNDYTGKKDYLNAYCKVVYLPRTEGISSSEIKRRLYETSIA